MKSFLIFTFSLFISLHSIAGNCSSCDMNETNEIKKCVDGNCQSFSTETHAIVRKISPCERKVRSLEAENRELKKKLSVVQAQLQKFERDTNIYAYKMQDASAKQREELAALRVENRMLKEKTSTVATREIRTVRIPQPAKPQNKRHVVSLMLGYGYTGYDDRSEQNSIDISIREGGVFGAQYQLNVTDSVYLGGFGLSNSTYGLLLGLGF